jgi:hypothetical protein
MLCIGCKIIKGKLFVCLVMHHAMRRMGTGGIAPPFLILTLGGGEWSGSRPLCFAPGIRAPHTRWIRGWMATGLIWTL